MPVLWCFHFTLHPTLKSAKTFCRVDGDDIFYNFSHNFKISRPRWKKVLFINSEGQSSAAPTGMEKWRYCWWLSWEVEVWLNFSVSFCWLLIRSVKTDIAANWICLLSSVYSAALHLLIKPFILLFISIVAMLQTCSYCQLPIRCLMWRVYCETGSGLYKKCECVDI